MIALWIVLGVLALLFLIAVTRGTLTIAYATGDTDKADGKPILRLTVAGITVFTVPKKKKKLLLRKYSRRAMRKRAAKEARRNEKAVAREAKKEAKKAKKRKIQKETGEKKGKKDIVGTIDMILDLVRSLLSHLSRKLKIKVARIRIDVAASDAAATAILYGAVSQSVAYLLTFLEENANLSYAYHPEVSVNADFLSTSTKADVSLSFSIRVFQAVHLLFCLFLRFLKHKNQKGS